MDTILELLVDDRGFIVSIELVLISTILVIGLIAGLTVLRDAVVSELSDVGGAIQNLNQSYSVRGIESASATSAGYAYSDSTDFADSPADPSGQADNCIIVFGTASEF